MIEVRQVHALRAKMLDRIKGFALKSKADSRLMRAVGWIANKFGVPFMTGAWTTLGTTIYFPVGTNWHGDQSELFRILAHEYVHLWRAQLHPIRYPLRYAFPQAFAALAPLFFVALLLLRAPWWAVLLGLLPLVFLAPWPSPPRLDEEVRGFVMEHAIDMWLVPGSDPLLPWSGYFTLFGGWGYYRMSPSSTASRAAFDARLRTVRDGSILIGEEGTPYRDVLVIVEEARRA